MKTLLALCLATVMLAQQAPQTTPPPAPAQKVAKKKKGKGKWIAIAAVAATATVVLVLLDKRLGNEGSGIF